VLMAHNMPFTEISSLEDAIPTLDILYMTRIQRERFEDKDEYERLKDSYILTPEKLTTAKKDLIIMHPLPRVNEISVSVDDDPRACYFKQALYGKYIRMALILHLLENADEKAITPFDGAFVKENVRCKNSRCILTAEAELMPFIKRIDEKSGACRCIYCDSKTDA